jgi:hypothetical protein
MMETVTTGTLAGTGSFQCSDCDYVVTLTTGDPLPSCPGCGGSSFTRASLFTSGTFSGEPPHESPAEKARSLDEARGLITEPGQYLAFEEGGRMIVVAIVRQWTRVGRSLAADVRFDDPTVSRRHALIVRQPDGVRVLDDRSLNGVFVNGSRVEWSPLADGDEIVVGRYRMHYLDTNAAKASSASFRRRIEERAY